MQKFAGMLLGLLTLAIAMEAEEFPGWAYPVNPPAGKAVEADNRELLHVPGSPLTFTRRQLAAIDGPVSDWHPEEHPRMPDIVANGRPPLVYSCGYCHLPTGAGRPENANLTGLTSAYIKEQLLAFKSGNRPGSQSARVPQSVMIALAQAATDSEIAAAAAYFASVPPASFVTVVETPTVPKTVVAGWMLVPAPGGGREPIGNRIVEVADDFERFEKRDSHTPYTAFVPPGSIARGAELVAGGGGRTLQCATCHGPDLRGLADVPRLVGRSPGYLVRQLYDIRAGNRKGGNVELMKPVVKNLTDGDLVAIAAYLASRAP